MDRVTESPAPLSEELPDLAGEPSGASAASSFPLPADPFLSPEGTVIRACNPHSLTSIHGVFVFALARISCFPSPRSPINP
jgi:hypothetical protein